MLILKQSTAVDVLIGPFVDSTDGDTEETGLTISASDVLLSKNGQGLTLKSDVTACAHDAKGCYNCELDATDTDTVGNLVLFVHESGALAVRHEFQVVEEAVYVDLFAASGAGYAALSGVTLAADAITSAKIADNAFLAVNFAADFLTSAKIADGAFLAVNFGADFITAASIADDSITSDQMAQSASDQVWGTTIRILTASTNFNDIAATDIVSSGAITTSSGAVVTVTTTGTTTTNTDLVSATDVWAAGTRILTASTNFNDISTAEVNTQCDLALTDIHLDHLMFSDAGDIPVNGSVIAQMVSATEDWSSFAAATDSLEAIRDQVVVVDTEVDKVVVATITNAAGTDISADVADVPTVSEFNTRTPTAAQLAYIVANAATGLPVVFTTSGGSTTVAVINTIDGGAGSATDDQYNGRLLVFTDGTLAGVVTDITDYTGSSTTATITAIPTAPTSSHNARLI